MNATGQIPPHRQPQPRTQQCSGQCGADTAGLHNLPVLMGTYRAGN